MQEDHCNCLQFGDTCMIIDKVNGGVSITIDERCPTIVWLHKTINAFQSKKHLDVLRKGGDKMRK